MKVLTDKEVVTRKQHKCHGCNKIFPIGSNMRYVTNVVDGSICSSYWCNKCERVIASLEYWQIEDGFAEGELRDRYPEKYRPYL